MLRTLLTALLGVFFLLSLASPAQAQRGRTYCVGGFKLGLYNKSQACDSLCHFHVHVSDGKQCFECWDECDNTCETVFLRENRGFFPISHFECLRMKAAPQDFIYRKVQDGKVEHSQETVTPKRKKVRLRPQFLRTSPGPHSTGDTLTASAAVLDPDGQTRHIREAKAEIIAADGSKSPAQVKLLSDGTVQITALLPPGGNSTLMLEVSQVQLQADEELDGNIPPISQGIKVSQCRLRLRLQNPKPGEVLLAGGALMATGNVLDARGRQLGKDALGNTPIELVLDSPSAGRLKSQAQVAPNGSLSAQMQAPRVEKQEEIALYFAAQGGPGDICPSPSRSLPLSALGLALEIEALPSKCYVGSPCPVALKILSPSEPKARQLSDAFLRSASLQGEIVVNGEGVGSIQKSSRNQWSGNFIPTLPGNAQLELRLSGEGQELSAESQLAIHWPLELRVPERIDLGSVPTGRSWLQTCQNLDLGASRGAEEQRFRLEVEQPEGCRAAVLLNEGGIGVPLSSGHEIEVGSDLAIPICLRSPRCGKGELQDNIKLHLSPVESAFADQASTVHLSWQLEGRSWLSCQSWWLGIVAALLLLIFIIYGFTSPAVFDHADELRVASNERNLSRALPRRLRELPGGRSGWYRPARVCLSADGNTSRSPSNALLVIEASAGGVLLSARGGSLRRLNPRTRKLEDVPEQQNHPLSRHAVYEIGGLYIRFS